MSFLLDTDTCSAFLKGNRNVQNRFLQYGGQLHISIITVGELFSGVFSIRASSRLLPGLLDADGPDRRFPGQDIALFRAPRAVIVLVGGQALVRSSCE
jgi:predicted nucleic acid-binding protein